MRLTILMIAISVFVAAASAQDEQLTRKIHEPLLEKSQKEQTTSYPFKPTIVKRPGHYTKTQWRQLIDSVWGPGIPTADKLQIFDGFWTSIDQKWGGFHNLAVNWDSLKNVYRPEIADGVSRGRFAAILTRLTLALNEMHSLAIDLGIDSTFGVNILGTSNYHYLPGVPLFNSNEVFLRSSFGAGLTNLPDSTALVYNVMPNHPLNLQPGDIILGYDGIPWLKLFNELLDAELPFLAGGRLMGSTPASFLHTAIISAGMNWGLFDTIDVKKYGTNQILHFPTSLLSAIQPPFPFATEQLFVPGVPYPDIQGGKKVSWGVIDGTSIGYIYALDWASATTSALFTQAVGEMMHKYNVRGLVLDFRTNGGGNGNYANNGFNYLFNFDPTPNYSFAIRIPGNDHFSFSLIPPDFNPLTPTPEIFDHPIAVLTGPECRSAGDFGAHKMRFHPMSRFFGLPTNGAYAARSVAGDVYSGPYVYNSNNGSVYSTYFNEGVLIHNPFSVDEQVWLTRDGVAKGEDDVVKKAMEWITTLTHAHSASVDRPYCRPGIDSISVKTILANPLNHQSRISAIIINTNGTVRDSAILYNDGLHGDASPGDSVWGCRFIAPPDENMFTVSIQTDDVTEGTYRRLPKVQRFTTAGPLRLDSLERRKVPASYLVKPHIRNIGKNFTASGAIVNLRSNDPWVTSIVQLSPSLPMLPPGVSSSTEGSYSVNYNEATFPGYFNLKVEIMVDGYTYWTDSTKLVLTGVEEKKTLPTVYELQQNYPNPFNPMTVISYQLPVNSYVTLKVYDLFGRKVSTLVDEKKETGRYTVQWDAIALPSGVYFYTLQAGKYRDAKRMLLLK